MSELFYRLLGSPALRFGQTGVEFGFERPIPAWGWALIALAAAGVAAYGYARLQGSRVGRLALGVLRGLLVLLLAVLIAGPRLIKPNETEEKDWVLVLVDRSASLTIADADASGVREPRETQLREILKRAEPTFAALKAQRVLVWLGFDASSYDLTVSASGAAQGTLPDLGEPRGQRTDISKAIDAAVRRAASRPISGIVLFSDGRSVDETSRALLRRLDAEKIPVFPIALGSSTAVPDLAVRRASAPRSAFLADAVPVEVELSRTAPGGTARTNARPEPSVVELIDTATGAVLDTREVPWTEPAKPADGSQSGDEPVEQTQRVTLTHRPIGGVAGNTKWTVRVRPAPGAPQDFVDSNNSAEVPIELVDRPMRVAYFDGYPRWEYRYLKNLLVREQSASAAIMLLASGKRYIQEGTVILDTLPRSPEDWAKYDVVILGDVWPGVFTQDQLAQLRDRVSIGGAGLIWIGGEGSTPGAWRTTPLNELLPFVTPENVGGSSSGLPAFDGPVTLAPTVAADRLGVLRLLDTPTVDPGSPTPVWFPPVLSNPETGWSRLYWVQKIDPAIIKPTAEVLALAKPVPGTTGDPAGQPAVLSMRYGAGRALYVATDEIWRWRYGRGELYPERFWIQLVRLLGRESLAHSGRPAIIEATPERGVIQQPIRIQVTLIDQALVEAAPRSIRVRVAPDANESRTGESSAIELTLAPDAPASAAPSVSPLGTGGRGVPRVFSTTWIPTEPGRYRAVADDPALGVAGKGLDDLTARIEVWQPDDELRRPQADHGNLAKLAEATGGKLLSPAEIAELPRLLPNRTLKLIGEPDVHTLWDTPIALLLVVLLLTLEWVGRRLLRLA